MTHGAETIVTVLGYAEACEGDASRAFWIPILYGAERDPSSDDPRYSDLGVVHPETGALIASREPRPTALVAIAEPGLVPRPGYTLAVFHGGLLPFSPALATALTLHRLDLPGRAIAHRVRGENAPARVLIYGAPSYLRRLCELVTADLYSARSVALTAAQLARLHGWILDLDDGAMMGLPGGDGDKLWRLSPPTVAEVRAAVYMQGTRGAAGALFLRTREGEHRRPIYLYESDGKVQALENGTITPVERQPGVRWCPAFGDSPATWALLHDVGKGLG